MSLNFESSKNFKTSEPGSISPAKNNMSHTRVSIPGKLTTKLTSGAKNQRNGAIGEAPMSSRKAPAKAGALARVSATKNYFQATANSSQKDKRVVNGS
jgi:hypothetical protein